MQRADSIREYESGEDIERRLLSHAGEGGKDDLLGVALDDFYNRCALDPLLGKQLCEHRRLKNTEPNIEADQNENEAQKERHAPAPGQELLSRHLAECKHGEIGEEQPARHPELGPRSDEAAGF